jgi:hypothetical protein
MKQWLRRGAAGPAFVMAAVSIPASALSIDSLVVNKAEDSCGVGMYWDTQTQACEPWAQAPYVAPIPVPIPNFSGCINVSGPRGRSGSACI